MGIIEGKDKPKDFGLLDAEKGKKTGILNMVMDK